VHKDFHLVSRTETGQVPVAGIEDVKVVRENGLYGQDRFSENPRSMFNFLKPLLPNYFSSEFSFAQFRIQDVHSIATVREDKFAVVVTRDGNYYLGEFGKDGGECKIISHRALVKDE
jgi:WD repeat-containing protein 45